MPVRVRSADGTEIAYERVGSGPALILVGGGLTDREENAPLAPALADRFTVLNYDRRGRGESGDTPPYALEREIDDLAALIDAAGGTAHLYGVSSGGALALEAAVAGLPVDRVGVYEVPYQVGDAAVREWQEYVKQLVTALAAGRRSAALELFMRLAGSSDDGIAQARASSLWSGLEAIAHTLAYDAACLGDGPPPTARLATVTRPALVLTGGLAGDFFDAAADAVAASMSRAERVVVDAQSHVADPDVIAPVLARFFGR